MQSQKITLALCLGLALFIVSCSAQRRQNPTIRSSASSATKSDEKAVEKGKSSETETTANSSQSEDAVDEESLEDEMTDATVEVESLPEAKQSEVKALLGGRWLSACTKSEDPNDPANVFYYKETFEFRADGTGDLRFSDFEDENCTMAFPGFEDYVFMVFAFQAVKEINTNHYYLQLNINKEFDGETLQDIDAKDLAMVEVTGAELKMENVPDLTATAFSDDVISYTKQ